VLRHEGLSVRLNFVLKSKTPFINIASLKFIFSDDLGPLQYFLPRVCRIQDPHQVYVLHISLKYFMYSHEHYLRVSSSRGSQSRLHLNLNHSNIHYSVYILGCLPACFRLSILPGSVCAEIAFIRPSCSPFVIYFETLLFTSGISGIGQEPRSNEHAHIHGTHHFGSSPTAFMLPFLSSSVFNRHSSLANSHQGGGLAVFWTGITRPVKWEDQGADGTGRVPSYGY
jgi:hypothetical protein